MDHFTYTITISNKSPIIKDDVHFSKFDDADYIQINSGKFNKLDRCQEKATALLKHLTIRENRTEPAAIVIQLNPRFTSVPGIKPNTAGWSKNTVMRLLTVDAEELKKEKKLTYTISGLIESSKPLTQEEFEIYFSSK